MENEKRLIDANELRIQFDDIPPYIGLAGSLVQQYIDKAHTVDAMEVVRCGNCKHFREPFCCRRDDETHRERINMLTVDFCSRGERKDNG